MVFLICKHGWIKEEFLSREFNENLLGAIGVSGLFYDACFNLVGFSSWFSLQHFQGINYI